MEDKVKQDGSALIASWANFWLCTSKISKELLQQWFDRFFYSDKGVGFGRRY